MLNKETCMRCCNIYSEKLWNEKDEERWKEGLIWCVKPAFIKINDPPDNNCRFFLEQTLLEDRS